MLKAHLTPPPALHEEVTNEAAEFFSDSNFLVAKLTDYCNLKCTYCHQDALTGKPILMPMETFKNAVRLILFASKAPTVSVQFHGGEPLLASDDFFREAVAFCRTELEARGKKVEFYIQTNLTRVTPEREALLRELRIGISFSLDGPPSINEEMRGGTRRILENWGTMRTRGTQAGLICLIQPSNWDRMPEVLEFFASEQMNTMRFNLMVPDGRGKGMEDVTADKLFQAKAIVLDFMLATKGKSVVDITILDAMKRFMKANGAPSSFEYHGCESLYCQAGRSLFSFNPDGSFYACDRIAEYPTWAMGNVNKPFSQVENVVGRKQRSAFHHKDEWWARCEGCDAKKICEFSCSAYYVHEVDTREVECSYTKKLWVELMARKEEIKEFLAESLPPVFIDEKKPKVEQNEQRRMVKEMQDDVSYNQLSLTQTLAMNDRFQLLKRGDQFFLYVFGRRKMFQVDALVAEMAKFNGCLPPEMISELLRGEFEAGKLQEAIQTLTTALPELISPSRKLTPSQFSAPAS